VIKINGSSHQRFSFPDEVAAATRYYRDFDRILGYLPHISLVQKFGPGQYRALYHTTELGVYRVKIYCDLQVQYDAAARTLRVSPLPGWPPIKQSVSVQALVAQGYFTSRSVFMTRGEETEIDYQLELTAALPKPLGLSLVPDAVMSQIAHSITDWRIHEIATGFIERSVRAYQTSVHRPAVYPTSRPRHAVPEPLSLRSD
jgi:hypothetical protein